MTTTLQTSSSDPVLTTPPVVDTVEVVVSAPDQWAVHAPAWDALAGDGARPGVVGLTRAWIEAYLLHREPAATACALFAYRGSSLCGVLPLIDRPHRIFGMRRPWRHVPSDVHTTGGGMLLGPAADPAVIEALVEGALRTLPRTSGLRFGGLWPADALTLHLRASPRSLVVDEGLGGRSLSTTGPWSVFHGSLGSNLRRNLRKARNRLEAVAPIRVTSSGKAAGLEDFLALEASGWKGREEGAVACAPALEGFYRQWCADLEAKGALQWHRLTQGARTLAMAMEVRLGTQVVLQRVAFDESERRHSPGQLLLLALLEGWFSDAGVTRVDCLTDQPWHQTWHMERTPYHAAHVFPPGLLAQTLGAWPVRIRERLRRSPRVRALVARLRKEGSS